MVQYVTSGKYSLCINTWYNLKQQKCLCHTDIGNLLCCPNRILQCAYLNPFSFVYVRFCIDVCDHNLYQGSVRTTAATCATRPGEADGGTRDAPLVLLLAFQKQNYLAIDHRWIFLQGTATRFGETGLLGTRRGERMLFIYFWSQALREFGENPKWRSFASDESVGGMWEKGWFSHPGPVFENINMIFPHFLS